MGHLLAQTKRNFMNEQHRPQIHFSPAAHWMNDPNGMVFYKGVYHLFFQHNPGASIWGPMHWGHATSKDLIHWQEQPIALYPDSLGTIFSGSAVADIHNTSGFGRDGKVPLVAIFTHHNDHLGAGRNDFQNQSIAYSLDEGKSWTKYSGNPVLKNPGIKDFRDPKVMWHEAGKKWVMTLATKDHITFYSSKNLKSWQKESEFGAAIGAHGGVWECPDLFSLPYQGKTIWVLLVSINPGGPNGGSATQYFTGNFDGKTFTPFETDTRWIDYGADNYAGITWSNTGSRKIFIGWMNNWQYANIVPTEQWRSANTIPRDLAIKKVGDHYYLASQPVKELSVIKEKTKVFENIAIGNYDLGKSIGSLNGAARIDIIANQSESFSFTLSNAAGEQVIAGYDKAINQYYIDRSKSGKIDFEKGFAAKHTAPRLSPKNITQLTLVIDDASIELFADDGLTVMTEIFFPNKPYDQMHIQSASNFLLKKIVYTELKSIWHK
ncbi:MAG: glycoside hydrolase family 32 protein [Ferruginibacter sp.]|nr:glycoside hydrolase family 32 protein [Ferruginibacter sp.]